MKRKIDDTLKKGPKCLDCGLKRVKSESVRTVFVIYSKFSPQVDKVFGHIKNGWKCKHKGAKDN